MNENFLAPAQSKEFEEFHTSIQKKFNLSWQDWCWLWDRISFTLPSLGYVSPEELKDKIREAENELTFKLGEVALQACNERVGKEVAEAQKQERERIGREMESRAEAGFEALPSDEQGFWKGYWQACRDKGQALRGEIKD